MQIACSGWSLSGGFSWKTYQNLWYLGNQFLKRLNYGLRRIRTLNEASKSGHRTDRRLPQSFVSSLFGNRKTLFTGVFVHILTYVIIFLSTRAVFFSRSVSPSLPRFAYRMYSFWQFDAADKAGTRDDIARWEARYVRRRSSFTSILGIGSGYAILIVQDPLAEFTSALP